MCSLLTYSHPSQYLLLIIIGIAWILCTFLLPETYAPVLLRKRAAKLRKETGDPSYMTEQERNKRSIGEIIKVSLFRPMEMLFMEPIILFITVSEVNVVYSNFQLILPFLYPSSALPRSHLLHPLHLLLRLPYNLWRNPQILHRIRRSCFPFHLDRHAIGFLHCSTVSKEAVHEGALGGGS
jgi:hypothetical protein